MAKKPQPKTKIRKPVTTKKLPVPAESHAVIDDLIRRVMPDLNPLVKQIDELICRTLPGLQFAIKWKRAYYGLPKQGWIIELAAYDVSVNIVFLGGADLTPPPPLGSIGRSRYVKLKSVEETHSPSLRQWIKQSGRVRGWK